jgi:hypothetical protein
MKHLKMLGLAAIAAMGLMAFVGAGTASATTLFTDSAKTVKYLKGTTFHWTLVPGTSWILTAPTGTVVTTCTSATIHGTTENETGATITSKISSLTWGGCAQTTHTIANGSLSINSAGEVTGVGTQVTSAIFGTSCTYGTGTGTKLGTLTGGAPAKLKVNATVSRIAGGFLCPASGDWEGEFVVTAPHATFVGA